MDADASPQWKLYHNPHFLSDSLHDSTHFVPHYEATSSTLHPKSVSTIMDELTLTLAEISKLRVELHLERRMRRAAESLAKSIARELLEERRARADAEAETARCRKAADRAVREADEDRRMLKLAEAWREERVKMKLAHAAIVLEERMREAAGNGMQKTGEVDSDVAARLARDRQGREVENPHIRRGINGFVEFSRAFRIRSPALGKERERGGVGFECERAQLRVLMK